jgi:transposase InsO family protein
VGCRSSHHTDVPFKALYGRDFRQRARRNGIDAIPTPIHAPKANAIVERLIGTLRRECLDHIMILGEQHLLAVLRKFMAYCNQDGLHRALGLQTPRPELRSLTGPVRSHSVLNGLHHAYERVA